MLEFNYECDDQMSIFDYLRKPFKITNKIRLIELFAGIGSQAMALRDIGADFESYRVIEFDKYAVASYNAIHGTDFTPSDIREVTGDDLGIVETDKYTYIMTYSFPCQDLSIAGKMRGMSKGGGTRSGLLWEVERLLDETEHLPQVLLMENVPMVHSDDNMPDFQAWIDFLSSKGYVNYWQDLNAKNYGVAQNRERCFMVSILGEYNFKFPKPVPLNKVMKDYLETEVDEKYYITSEKAKKLIDTLILEGKILTDRQTDRQTDSALTALLSNQVSDQSQTVSRQDMTAEYQTNSQMETWWLNMKRLDKQSDVACTLNARDWKGFGTGFNVMNGVVEWKKIITVGNIGGGQTQSRTVYMPQGLSPTLCSGMEHGNTIPYIVEVKKMDVEVIGKMDHTLDNTFESANRVYNAEKVAPSIITMGGQPTAEDN